MSRILLAALASVFQPLLQGEPLLIDVEAHGREVGLVPGINLSRTIGWFTSVYPVALSSPDPSNPAITLPAVKESLRKDGEAD